MSRRPKMQDPPDMTPEDLARYGPMLAEALETGALTVTPEQARAEIERRKAERNRSHEIPALPLRHKVDALHKEFGGTNYEEFNSVIVNQAHRSNWCGNAQSDEERISLALAAAGALASISPQDAIEAMLAAQMVATHNATMECYRRAMIAQQTFEGRQSALAHANKLTRSFATLSQAFDKHRGRGQQTVRVEHVHVHEGGQAIVGNVNHGDRQRAERAVPLDAVTPGGEKDDD